MEEVHSDFSKLPEQDFANSSMLEELIEVQTELKMAEGALTKKAADIAVPETTFTNPDVPVSTYRDLFGNRCHRLIEPTAGKIDVLLSRCRTA